MALPQRYAGTGWYVAAVLAVGIAVQSLGSQRVLIADAGRYLAMVMLAIGTVAGIIIVFDRRSTGQGLTYFLGLLNFSGLGVLNVARTIALIGEPPTPYLGATVFLVGVGMWSFLLMLRRADQVGR